MVEAKRPAVDEVDAPAAKRPSGGSGALEEDLEAELDAEQDQQAEEDVDAIMFDDDIELHLGEAGRNWTRPEPKPHDPRKDKLGMFADAFWLFIFKFSPFCRLQVVQSAIVWHVVLLAVFQQMEVDYIIGHPNKDVHNTDLAEVPIIRMYGVTESGKHPDMHGHESGCRES